MISGDAAILIPGAARRSIPGAAAVISGIAAIPISGVATMLPAPDFEPATAPCIRSRSRPARRRARARTQSAAQSSPRSCRNHVMRNAAARRTGTVALQRVLQASHAAKSHPCDAGDTAPRQFAGAALRLALEVLDGRRSPVQLRPLAEPSVIAVLRTLAEHGQAPGSELGAATLTRIDVIMAGAGAAEVCAGYDRGTRHFALAARIVRGRSGWRLTVFRVC
ncbi:MULTISPECIES: Rv3235 family protein [unclassified Nocardia]|uniref:Rv3235 family protein n=1 Tax=unclassified Nocardia TaxID=2637762 RepID=UPI0035DB6E9E